MLGEAVVLIVLAVLLFAADIKVGAQGLLTTVGLAALLVGGIFLIQSVPGLSPWPVAIAFVGVAAFAIVVSRKAVMARRVKPFAGPDHLVGSSGEVTEDVDARHGRVMVEGVSWPARAAGPTIAAGSPVLVVAVEGLHLLVRPYDAGPEAPAGPPRPAQESR